MVEFQFRFLLDLVLCLSAAIPAQRSQPGDASWARMWLDSITCKSQSLFKPLSPLSPQRSMLYSTPFQRPFLLEIRGQAHPGGAFRGSIVHANPPGIRADPKRPQTAQDTECRGVHRRGSATQELHDILVLVPEANHGHARDRSYSS